MCGTMNDQNAQSCSFCGYLFEDYGTGTVNQSAPQNTSPQSTPLGTENTPIDTGLNKIPETSNRIPTLPSISSTGSSPLFVVSRSILGTLVPSIIYLFLIAALGLFSTFNLYSIILVLVFVLFALVPSLMSPRRFEFYDGSMKVHKIIGGDSEYSYSNMSMLDYGARGRSQQMVLSVAGQRRPLVIGKNPKNSELGIDLKQFLNSKLSKSGAGSQDKQAGNSSDNNPSQSGENSQSSF